jgi:hypothetical protein
MEARVERMQGELDRAQRRAGELQRRLDDRPS